MTQNPDAVELLPCPFCGGSPSLYNDPDNGSDGEDDRYYIACHNGCASGIYSSNRRMISERWNTRDTAERDDLKAEVDVGKRWRERCEELEVVAAALYLGHDDGKMQFDIYRSSYITTTNDDIMWERTALEGESR